MKDKVVLIGGGTGMIGKAIVDRLTAKGMRIKILTRNPKPGNTQVSYHKWDIRNMVIENDILQDVDYIINLTGAGIADKRWTAERKKVLIDSRVDSTALLEKSLREQAHTVRAFISASAIGYYGDRGSEVLTEKSKPGTGFMAECCKLWEEAADKVAPLVNRLVKIRIGTVMDKNGGALPKFLMTKAIRLFNYFGNGRQYYAWISLDDIADMFIMAIENQEMQGIYNGVAPEAMMNKAFTREIMRATVGKGLLLPAPKFALRLILGEMANVVLNSTNVKNERIAKTAFQYKHKDLNSAIKNILK